MRDKPVSLHTSFVSHTVLIACTSLLLWCALWFRGEYVAFRVETDGLRQAHLQSCQTLLKREVDEVVVYIDFMRRQTRQRLRATLEQRVRDACDIATNIYNENVGVRSDAEIQKMIRDALRPIRFNRGRGYYFVVSADGVQELSGMTSVLEGTNILRSADEAKSSVVAGMMAALGDADETFYEYAWTKPDHGDTPFAKVSFIKRFGPYPWVIGTGEYWAEAEQEAQDEVLSRLITLRFGDEGYFFGSTYDHDPLFSNGVVTRGGENLQDLTDPNGVKILQEQRRLVEHPAGGFQRYSWRKLNAENAVPKLSFVKGVPEWRWIIGAGAYLDTIEDEIAAHGAQHQKLMLHTVRSSLLVLAALIVLIVWWARRVSAKTRDSIGALSEFFLKANTEPIALDPKQLHFVEFGDIAVSANRMLEARLHAEEALRESEKHLRQAEKMEQLGTLAGGIAHDFNNVLGAIISYAEMAQGTLTEAEPGHRHLSQVLQAAHRARELVRQILAFSRTSDRAMAPIHVAGIVAEALSMLRASIPVTVEMSQDLSAREDIVLGEATEIHQLVVNLCTNAFHAMEEAGGTLHVELADVVCTADGAPPCPGLAPGRYLRLTVRDTGPGIDPAVRQRIFEPYFTTKSPEKGTGMGLAAVHGIVMRHRGSIDLESREGGWGATFRVYLPLADGPAPEVVAAVPVRPPQGAERILLVDDERSLAHSGGLIIASLGYEVTSETDSERALALFAEAPDRFDLVITDQTMPRLTGDAMATEMLKLRPDIPIILCTGYSNRVDEEKAHAIGIRSLATKPLLRKELAVLIRKVLDNT